MPSNKFDRAFLEEPSLPGRIRYFLKQEDMSQMYLAKHLKVAQQTVHCWCKGLNIPSTVNMYNLAKIMGITIKELLPDNKDDLWDE